MVMTASTLDAALSIPPAAAPPPATSLSTAAVLTSKPATECPALLRLSDIGNPMLPSPMNPTRAMDFLPILPRSRRARARRHERETDIGEDRRKLAEHHDKTPAVDLRKDQLHRRHGNRCGEPHHAAPCRRKAQAHRRD